MELGLNELRGRQLRILSVLAEHCEANGLRYYLAAGTLLGAVRHRGYIPWDDDIDVMMPRADYERFCETFDATGSSQRLQVFCSTAPKGYPLPFAKVCDLRTRLEVESGIVKGLGIFVDVFPLDGWHNGLMVRWFQRIVLSGLLHVVLAKHLVLRRRRKPWRAVLLVMAKVAALPVPDRLIPSAITAVSRLGSLDTCRAGGILVWGAHESVPSRAYGAPIPLRFEGRDFAGPEDADLVLTAVFGEYMTLPPVEQRVSNHRFSAYVLDDDTGAS